MARPRKPESEKLVRISTSVPPSRFDELDRLAKASDMKLAELLRKLLTRPFRDSKTPKLIAQP